MGNGLFGACSLHSRRWNSRNFWKKRCLFTPFCKQPRHGWVRADKVHFGDIKRLTHPVWKASARQGCSLGLQRLITISNLTKSFMTRFLRSNRLKPQRFQIDIKFLLSLHPQRCVSKQDTGVSLGEMMSSPSFIRFQVFCETRTSYRALIKSVLHPTGARNKIKRNSQESEQK